MKDRSEKTAIIFIGIQASGKSTFYHERFEDYVYINLDTLHTRNKEKMLLQECPIALQEIENGKGKQGYRIRLWQVRITNWNFRDMRRVSTNYSMSL